MRLLWLVSALGMALATGLESSSVARAEGAAEKHPVYVGVKQCSKCHGDRPAGHQFSRWRLSAHAGAYAVLSKPESRKITELSGIPEEPQKAKLCLGCHATAADVEEWERDEGFHVEDGLQCEKCHGPGSEYMPAGVMRDRKLAMERGLKMPSRDDCMMCHRVKGSHEAVLKKKPFDMEMAWKAISHPVPEDRRALQAEDDEAEEAAPPAGKNENPGKFKYAGIMACAQCHAGPMMGYQFSKWRLSPHARAHAVLASARGYEMARQAGIKGNPQKNPGCLKCHAAAPQHGEKSLLEGFDVRDGVQCESCHGPGSDYAAEAVMLDRVAARQAGLLEVTEATCARCHEKAHGKPFEYHKAVQMVAHPTEPTRQAADDRYKTPLNLALTPDGRELWVACEASRSVILVDTASRRKVAEIEVGGQPTDVAFSPDGRRAYVTNRLDDTLSVVDVPSRRVVKTLAVGDEPHGVLTDRPGRYIYVLNTSIDNISIIDAASLEEVKRLTASRAPWSLALSPDGTQIFVTNTLSRFVKFRTPSMSEVTVIDTGRAVVEDRFLLPAANLLQGVSWHPSGEYAVVTLNRTKNLVPMTRLLQGWTITNGMALVWRDGRVDQVLLDQPHLYFPDPADAAVTPDGRYALVTSSGSNRVAVVDLEKLISMLEAASPHERRRVFPNHLGKPTEFVVKFIATEDSPRGVLCAPDGKTAYTANALDDSVTVIDLNALEAVARIDLGGSREITRVRRGEKLFHSANITFRRQFSCHTCHPDGHIDGITYDIEPDGIGVSPVDNRTLRGILDMAPFKWEGTNPSLQRQCGPRLAVFFTRIQPFAPDELEALDNYICTIPRPPNRYRALGAPLTPAQRRGKEMFERTMANDGRMLAPEERCVTCHPPPLFTDGKRHDVGTKMELDRESHFDAPHLNNIYDSAPYLHNGRAETLEEIWTRFNPYDQHGVTNDMTKDQLNDLVEYLKTL
jgi:YVTN family beta-propeller protein